MRLVVSNTGPLMHLSQAQSLDLLRLLGAIHTPPAVATEAARHISAWAPAPPAWINITSLQPAHASQAQAWEKAGLLDWGEAEALALTRQLNADWFLTDDTAARVLAASLGIEVHGSLGIVLWAAATGHLNRSEAEAALSGLAASTLWLSARVLQEAKDVLDRIFPVSNS
jgi:predicted nucleic acid-binding protein